MIVLLYKLTEQLNLIFLVGTLHTLDLNNSDAYGELKNAGRQLSFAVLYMEKKWRETFIYIYRSYIDGYYLYSGP